MAYVYILHCAGDTLYTGITTDLARRMDAHRGNGPAGAKYTRSHPPKGFAALWEADDMQTAAKIEYRIKRWPAAKKRKLIKAPALLGSAAFPLPDGVFCRALDLPQDIF